MKSLYCNISDCRLKLTDKAWVTRCFHLFCEEHGRTLCGQLAPQFNCPICRDVNTKEKDVLLCDLNLNDMVVAGLAPSQCLTLVSKSLKLWKTQYESYRMEEMKTAEALTLKCEQLSKSYEAHCREYDEARTQHASLKDELNQVLMQTQTLIKTLEKTQRSLNKYKTAYKNLKSTTRNPGREAPSVVSSSSSSFLSALGPNNFWAPSNSSLESQELPFQFGNLPL